MRLTTSALNGTGQAVFLGAEIGKGGEGSVYEVRTQSHVVAKIYHKPISKEKQQKIKAMVEMKSDSLLRIATWPLDTLTDTKGQVIGFVMSKLSGKDLHKLYGPKTRLIEFPSATYAFLIHTASNLARSFAVVHENNHVIGDINHGNFYVNEQGIVKLVDCDSFQVKRGNELFRCEVGIPMYQPPELHDVTSFRDIDRTENHDNFGLAVFIFMLLFMGRHPFAGRYLGSGDMPIEKAIKEFRFAYGSQAASKQMLPPPGALPFHSITSEVSNLFERAFAPEGISQGRPKAAEWLKALDSFSSQIQKCPHKESHLFPNRLPSCPWCELETKAGIILFHSITAHIRLSGNGFKLEASWTQIINVPSPGHAKALPEPATMNMQPSAEVTRQATEIRKRKWLLWLPALLGLACVICFPMFWFWIGAFTIFVTYCLRSLLIDNRELKADLTRKQTEAKLKWGQLSERWHNEAGQSSFDKKLSELTKCMQEYQGLEDYKKHRIKQMCASQRDRQLKVHLQRYRLEDAKIDGIGPSRKATLAAYGIESAADVSQNAIRQVPGFGPSFTRKLISWKNDVERLFVYDSSKGIPKSDLDDLDMEVAAKRKKLEQELLAGPTQLLQIGNQIKVRRNSLWNDLVRCAEELAQAEADANSLK